MALQALLLAWLLHLAVVAAQAMIQPSNISATDPHWNITQLVLSFKQEGAMMTFGVDDALSPWSADTHQFTDLMIGGNIVLTTTQSVANLSAGDIAYMSCEPSNYTGNLTPDAAMNMATEKISGGQDGGNTAGAIVLYSTVSAWCNFTPPDTYSYNNVFILPLVAAARHLETTLQSPNATVLHGQVVQNLSTSSNNTADFNSDDLGPTPTTTVAMIILYSVTGIITLCFIVVIITGAIRAHRHPDRYGLLNLPGGAHQRRARALARAMLDTLPIVKFGEREPPKRADPEHGTELSDTGGGTSPDTPPGATVANPETSRSTENDTETPDHHPEESATQTQPPLAPEGAAEAGLACSVCTEDFVKGQDTRVLPCNHKFHPECIDPWLLNVSGTCPLCRVDLHPPESAEHSSADGNTSAADDSPASLGPGGTPIYRPLRFTTLLNPRRMRTATPEQRVRALRDLRNAQRARDTGAANEATRAPRIRGTRLTRLFRRDTSSVAHSPDVPDVPNMPPQHTTEQQPSAHDAEHASSSGQGEADESRS